MPFHQIVGTLLSALMHAMDNPGWLKANPLAHKAKSYILSWLHAYGNQQPYASNPAEANKPTPLKNREPPAPPVMYSAAAPAPSTLPEVTGNETKTWRTVENNKKQNKQNKQKKQSRPQSPRNPKCCLPDDGHYVVIQKQGNKLYIVWLEYNGIIRKLKIVTTCSSSKYQRTFKSKLLLGKEEWREVLFSTLVKRGGYISIDEKSGWATFRVLDDKFYDGLADMLL
jgi:hypothetical protein